MSLEREHPDPYDPVCRVSPKFQKLQQREGFLKAEKPNRKIEAHALEPCGQHRRSNSHRSEMAGLRCMTEQGSQRAVRKADKRDRECQNKARAISNSDPRWLHLVALSPRRSLRLGREHYVNQFRFIAAQVSIVLEVEEDGATGAVGQMSEKHHR